MKTRNVLAGVIFSSMMMLSLATAVVGDVIVDTFNLWTTPPVERIVNNFYIKWDTGFGVDQILNDNCVAVTETSANPNAIKYAAPYGFTFKKMTASFAIMDGQCAFDLYDAVGTQVKTWTQTLDHEESGGAIKWYTIEADCDGYDFRELFIKVWGWPGYGALGTVQLETKPLSNNA